MPGVLWVRLKLPFRINHVNIYMLARRRAWTMVDSGLGQRGSDRRLDRMFEVPLVP